MRRAWLVQSALAIVFAAAFAWIVSQPSLAGWYGGFAIGLIAILLALRLLSLTPIAPALKRIGIGAFRTTAERRLSFMTSFFGATSVYVMTLTLGPHPSFRGVFSWQIATFAIIGAIYVIARRRRQAAFG